MEFPERVSTAETGAAECIQRTGFLSCEIGDTTGVTEGQFQDADGCTPNKRVGSKAIVQISGFEGIPLSQIDRIEITARALVANQFYLNFLVTDQAGQKGTLVVDSTAISALNLTGKMNLINVKFGDPIFKAVGKAFGLPDHNSTTPAALPSGLTFKRQRPVDCGIPAFPLGDFESVQMVIGDSLNTKPARIEIQDFTVVKKDGTKQRIVFGATPTQP
jgi:hypothetical protein